MPDKVLFIPLILFWAYLLKHSGVFREKDSDIFVNYVIYFALPALTFDLARNISISSKEAGVILVAWVSSGLGLAVSLILSMVMNMEPQTRRAFMLVSSFGNTAFLGYPFAWAYFGEGGFTYAVLYDQVGSFLAVITVGFVIATGRIDLREVITFPPLLSLIAGFIMRGEVLPKPIEELLDITGGSLIPAILFALGLKLSFSNLRGSALTGTVAIGIKMILVPMCIFGFLKFLGANGEPFKIALLQSSMPPMVTAGILAMKFGLDSSLALFAITGGMLASFVSVPLIMSLAQSL